MIDNSTNNPRSQICSRPPSLPPENGLATSRLNPVVRMLCPPDVPQEAGRTERRKDVNLARCKGELEMVGPQSQTERCEKKDVQETIERPVADLAISRSVC